MAIQTKDNWVNALANGQQLIPVNKNLGTTVAGGLYSYWVATGTPGPGVTPASGLNGDIPTKATAGALQFDNPTGGNELYFARGVIAFSGGGQAWLYDRLWHNTYTVTSVSSQAISPPALDRPDALGVGAEAWWQVYATMGAATPTITITYTDDTGATGKTSALVGISGAFAARQVLWPLNTGENGIQSIQSIQNSASHLSGTAGIVLRRKIVNAMWSGTTSQFGQTIDATSTGLARVYADACLEFVGLPLGASLVAAGAISVCEG